MIGTSFPEMKKISRVIKEVVPQAASRKQKK